MGYYLSIDYPKLGFRSITMGGKFFGYLDEAEFKDCWSYQYLKRENVKDAELLNVFWSCYSFELTKAQALVFLTCYARDVKQYKGEEFITFDSGKRMPKWYAELWGNATERSKTFQGIAEAMAEQWGEVI